MSAKKSAGVAQLVEQLICNQQVRGSSPFTSSINGRVPERPKGTDCKSVAIQLRWFESTLFHQQKPSTFLGIRFLFCKKNMLVGGFEPRNYQCDGLRQQANFERSSSPPSSTSRNRVPFGIRFFVLFFLTFNLEISANVKMCFDVVKKIEKIVKNRTKSEKWLNHGKF